VSAGVLFAIGSRFQVDQLLPRLSQVAPFYLVAAFVLALLIVPVVGNRWKLLARMITLQISFAAATRATFAGLFVGQVLPGAIGADVVRGWMVWSLGTSNKLLIASLVMDQLISLLAVTLMIAVTFPLLIGRLPEVIVFWVEWSLKGVLVSMQLGYISIYVIRGIFKNEFLERGLGLLSSKNMRLSAPAITAALAHAIVGHSLTILSAYFLSLAIRDRFIPLGLGTGNAHYYSGDSNSYFDKWLGYS